MTDSDYVGEVIESSTRLFLARTPEVGVSPPLGSFVKTSEEPVVYGVVVDISTRSRDPGRRAEAMGMPLEELRREQPQIFEILATEFQALAFAHREGGSMRYSLPPLPPPIHAFVTPCSDEEAAALGGEDFVLRAVVSFPSPAVDDLLVAVLRYVQRARADDRDYIVRMGKSLSRMFKDDYERLVSVLRRVV